MVTLTYRELSFLCAFEAFIFQNTAGISGQVRKWSREKYGIPVGGVSYQINLDHASDLDVVEWGKRVAQQDMSYDNNNTEREVWRSMTGQTSLYGPLVLELCRRLEVRAYRDIHSQLSAGRPTERVAP